MHARWPQNTPARLAVAVTVGWIAFVALTIYVYNPSGIAAATARGVDSPEMRYDNNTVASALLGGWIYSLLSVAGFSLLKRRRQAVKRRT